MYYSRDGVRVTKDWVVVDGYRYAVRDLNGVRAGRSAPGPWTFNAGVSTGALAVIVGFSARFLDAAGWLGAGITLAVPGAIFALGLLRRARTHEMWAYYHGLNVKLLSTSDADRCAQIYRAVHLAKEHAVQ
jgi:hypothetical protein